MKKHNLLNTFFLVGAFGFPLLAFAQAPRDLIGLINLFLKILGALIPLLVGIALVAFLWGVAKFILNADDSTKRKEGSQLMIYGIIGLFVMLAVWGLVGILGQTFGVKTILPQLTPSGGGGGGGFSAGGFTPDMIAESVRGFFDDE